jgi:hypothetical protein
MKKSTPSKTRINTCKLRVACILGGGVEGRTVTDQDRKKR